MYIACRRNSTELKNSNISNDSLQARKSKCSNSAENKSQKSNKKVKTASDDVLSTIEGESKMKDSKNRVEKLSLIHSRNSKIRFLLKVYLKNKSVASVYL